MIRRSLPPILAAIVGVALWWGLPQAAGAAPETDLQALEHVQEMERSGVLRDPVWANAYWSKARAAESDGAREVDLRWALRFDPELNGARWDLVALLARNRDTEVATHVLDALRVGFGTFPGQQRALVWTLTLAYGALAATLALLTILSVAGVLPRVHHAIRERLHFLPTDLRSGAALLTLVVPLLLPLTLAPTAALFWLLLLGTVGGWTLLGVAQRRVAAAAIVVILVSPVVLSGWTRITAPGLPTAYLHALWANRHGADGRDMATLLSAPADVENDPVHWASLALADRRRGDFAAAARSLRRAAALEPDAWAHWNNLANVQLLAGYPDAALASYARAHRLAPSEPLVYANEAQAHVSRLEFAKADAALAEAARFGYHLPPLIGGGDGIVRDQTLDARALWMRFVRGQDQSRGLSAVRTAAMIGALLVPVRPAWMSLLLLLAVWYVSLTRTLPRAFSCASCGTPICRKCHYRVMRRSLCSHCHAIRRDVQAPLRRQSLLQERHHRVARWGRVFAIVASAALPGAGLALRGLLRRAAVLLCAAALLVLAVTPDVLWPDPALGTPGARAGLPSALFIALYAVVALISVLGTVKAHEHTVRDPRSKPLAPGPL